jgi:RimJ/RimL family protein N-acetyltransferase
MSRVTVLSTNRLVLRLWAEEDIEPLTEIFAEPRVWWFPSKRGWRRDETEAFLERRLTEWRDKGWGHWAVEHNGVLIGFTGFALPTFLPELMPVPEIGWRFHPAWWGRGFATEAATAALAHGFTHLGFAEVVSIYEPANTASGRVMERLGMTPDREALHPDLGIPLRVYRLAGHDWRRKRCD